MRDTDFSVVSELAKDLSGVVHAVSSRGESLKVRGKLMACQAINKSAEPHSIMVRVSKAERKLLIASAPGTYYVTAHYENYPAVLVRLSAVSRRDLKQLLKASWQYVLEKSR